MKLYNIYTRLQFSLILPGMLLSKVSESDVSFLDSVNWNRVNQRSRL